MTSRLKDATNAVDFVYIGRTEFTFDAEGLANGAYFYALSNRDGKAVRRMVIAR